MSIGSRIKEAREKAGYSQVRLSEIIGVSKGAVGNYESDKSSPKDIILFRIMEALHCDANFLFQDEMKKSPAPAEAEAGGLLDEKRLLTNYNDLNRKGKQKLLSYSDDLISSGNYAAAAEDAG